MTKINYKKQNDRATFSDLEVGDLYRHPRDGGLLMKVKMGGASANAVVIDPINDPDATPRGGDSWWSEGNEVIPVKSITVET